MNEEDHVIFGVMLLNIKILKGELITKKTTKHSKKDYQTIILLYRT